MAYIIEIDDDNFIVTLPDDNFFNFETMNEALEAIKEHYESEKEKETTNTGQLFGL